MYMNFYPLHLGWVSDFQFYHLYDNYLIHVSALSNSKLSCCQVQTTTCAWSNNKTWILLELFLLFIEKGDNYIK